MCVCALTVIEFLLCLCIGLFSIDLSVLFCLSLRVYVCVCLCMCLCNRINNLLNLNQTIVMHSIKRKKKKKIHVVRLSYQF